MFPFFLHIVLMYLLAKNHRFAEHVVWAWAIIYLLVFTGIKVGAKSLIIWRGDGWEINSLRYYIDLFLLSLGLLLIFFGNKMTLKKENEI